MTGNVSSRAPRDCAGGLRRAARRLHHDSAVPATGAAGAAGVSGAGRRAGGRRQGGTGGRGRYRIARAVPRRAAQPPDRTGAGQQPRSAHGSAERAADRRPSTGSRARPCFRTVQGSAGFTRSETSFSTASLLSGVACGLGDGRRASSSSYTANSFSASVGVTSVRAGPLRSCAQPECPGPGAVLPDRGGAARSAGVAGRAGRNAVPDGARDRGAAEAVAGHAGRRCRPPMISTRPPSMRVPATNWICASPKARWRPRGSTWRPISASCSRRSTRCSCCWEPPSRGSARRPGRSPMTTWWPMYPRACPRI